MDVLGLFQYFPKVSFIEMQHSKVKRTIGYRDSRVMVYAIQQDPFAKNIYGFGFGIV
jgi:predicted N-acetyltransferase YhbS